ncbi:MAG: bifunctional UDP-N-acetylglucosamine diphosphorylase/glucosamine-1-phosphate N-acetyltransferase GlmU [Propionibacteriaceae bacterium]
MTAGGVSAVIVLAAGGGTRMKSTKSKLLHEVSGRPMLTWAVEAADALNPDNVVVVVGHQREQVLAHLDQVAPHVATAVQEEQKGTGHAVACGLADLVDGDGEVVVTYGDVPMLTAETLHDLVAAHRVEKAAVTVLTAELENPYGYGRIVRDIDGCVARIVEQKDADEATAEICEINSGIYVFDAAVLRNGIGKLRSDNAQGEYYLTDMISIARQDGGRVAGYLTEDLWQTEGVNDRVQLAAMNKEMNRRITQRWMREGVTILDPATTWIHASVQLAADVTLLPGTMLEGATQIAAGAVVGPDTTLTDCQVGEGARIIRSVGQGAIIGARANVGPFAYLRQGTQLGESGKIGTFVETKNTVIAPGAKVPHLCYAGDAIIDEGANIGAGTIFANYDGANKWKTHVGKNSFIGSNSVLVGPVDIADGSFVAAGSAITDDVAPGGLAIARGRQRNVEGWVADRKPDTKWDEVAKAASGDIHPAVQADRDKQSDMNNEEKK